MGYGSTGWRPCSIATSANRVSGSRTVYGAGENPEAMIGFLHFGLMWGLLERNYCSWVASIGVGRGSTVTLKEKTPSPAGTTFGWGLRALRRALFEDGPRNNRSGIASRLHAKWRPNGEDVRVQFAVDYQQSRSTHHAATDRRLTPI